MSRSEVICGTVFRESLENSRFSLKLGITGDLMCLVLGKTVCFRRGQGRSPENMVFPKPGHMRSPVIPSFIDDRGF